MGTLRTQRRSAIGASTPPGSGYPPTASEADHHAAGIPSTSEASVRAMGQSHDVGACELAMQWAWQPLGTASTSGCVPPAVRRPERVGGPGSATPCCVAWFAAGTTCGVDNQAVRRGVRCRSMSSEMKPLPAALVAAIQG